MKTNRLLAFLLQVLTEKIIAYIHSSKDRDFVWETLKMTSACLNGEEIDPDLLYSRLENLGEEDILTYFELDDTSSSEVWTCVADAVSYICLINYEQQGEIYLPETIEAVDVETVDEFFENYKECLHLFNSLKNIKEELLNDERIDLDNPVVKEKYDFLFS